jgi:hypothetical protein
MDTNWCMVCDKKTGDELYCSIDCLRKDIVQMKKPAGNDDLHHLNGGESVINLSGIWGKPINVTSSILPLSNSQASTTTTTRATTITATTSVSSMSRQDESRPRALPRRRGLSFMQELQCERQQERWRQLNYPNHMSAVSTK